MGRPDILVVGAGVSGLTTAVLLAEQDYSVHVVAELPPRETTSAMAGASWAPCLHNDDRTLAWAEVTRSILEELAAEPRSGVRLVPGLEVSDEPGAPPDWAAAVDGYRPWNEDEQIKAGPRYQSGWHYRIPLVDMPAYLDYLADRLAAAGGTTEFGRRVRSLSELRDAAGRVVNCTGLGARELVPDERMFATRGQLVVVENPGIDEFFQDNVHEDDLTYIFPHGDHVVLGGCANDHVESEKVSIDTTDAILERCVKIEPRLSGAKVIDHRVGLRPNRDRVCLEAAVLDGLRVIHNYGHGSVGVSLSWGCAEAVHRLIG